MADPKKPPEDAESIGNAFAPGNRSSSLEAYALTPKADAEKLAKREALRRERSLLPAPYVDTWATITWAGHVRVVLGEGFRTGEIPRTAFMMELDDAENFALYLLEIVARRKAKDGGEDPDHENFSRSIEDK